MTTLFTAGGRARLSRRRTPLESGLESGLESQSEPESQWRVREPTTHAGLVPAQASAPDTPVSRRPGTSDEIFPALSRLSLGTRLCIIALCWGASVATSTVLEVGPDLHDVALTVHVLSLVTGFGAVLMVDWHGALWMLARRGLHESTRIAAAASPLIWLGIGGLLASGALLHPELGEPLTVVKLVLVLTVALNGAALSATRRSLADRPAGDSLSSLPPALRRSVLLSGVVSQLAWWGAIAVGFLTAAQRI